MTRQNLEKSTFSPPVNRRQHDQSKSHQIPAVMMDQNIGKSTFSPPVVVGGVGGDGSSDLTIKMDGVNEMDENDKFL